MGALTVELDPAQAGFDARRLERIDRHFGRYAADGRLAGWLAVVARHGEVVHVAHAGVRDVESGDPVELDTVWRIYSMTKPITSVAAMMLYEEGAFELSDPVSRFIPSFAGARRYAGGPPAKPLTVPAAEPVRMWHLLTHTSGLTYGFHRVHPVDAIYRDAGFEWSTPPGLDLAACCDAWAELPLLFEPGSEWNYGVSTDVLGRVVEILSGQSLDDVFAQRIFAPLGMTETAFTASPERLATLYGPGLVRNDVLGAAILRPPDALSGGGGLASTAADYQRFVTFLLNEGELDGVRLLGSRTMRHMFRNQLPGGADREQFGRPLFADVSQAGSGFGLGFAVLVDPVANRVLATPGELSWGGAASTAFWVDREEGITVTFFTQLLPSSTYPIRTQLRQLVYQALVP